MTRRYVLFTYDNHYPKGGLNDELGRFDTLAHIKAQLDSLYTTNVFTRTRKARRDKKSCIITEEICHVDGPDNFQVLDLNTGQEVYPFEIGFETPERYEKIIDIEWLQ